MTEIRTRMFDGKTSDVRAYLVCGCGYPVWHMNADTYLPAEFSLEQCARPWRRKKALKEAGGKHTAAEIRAILELQKGRCIYCNIEFTTERRPTRDHLIPLVMGGGDWALIIVLACHSYNARRGEIPFRTFCRLLSPKQNERILNHLYRRIKTTDFKKIDEGYGYFEVGLRLHEPHHGRYKMILTMKRKYRENAKKNKLFPAGVDGVLRELIRRTPVELRKQRQVR